MTTEEILTKAAKRECPECSECSCQCHSDGRHQLGLSCCPHPVKCKSCDGTGLWLHDLSSWFMTGDYWIVELNDRDRLDAAAERLGYPVSLRISDATAVHGYFKGTEDIYREMGHYGFGPEAQQAALVEVIKKAWPEVEDVG